MILAVRASCEVKLIFINLITHMELQELYLITTME